ncbi:hypothetical protein [Asticcacaulis benevestitus]|uniref:Lipoprotein SmpA/OmlA domain-containing protein n=1 Tax=Asticcacaulis benevestitus DSM 16100 = ATCC BAA-896 TaxID=1121022 RepID=V4PTE8_9CAUL|nr:hypothetical protein [Asticcacaulis benevestitus]ESQ88830.1 hypothetical protein ABENE_15080 [Asticcacaulis benevestitus DSM 16100 = ATCC BAA-896]
MKPIIVLVAFSALVSSSGAQASNKGTIDRAGSIVAGQNKTDVNLIMGEPGNREFKGSEEAWQYCGRSGMTNKYVVIYFLSGKVEKLATYSQPWAGSCEEHYKPVAWDQAEGNKAKP